MQNKISSLTRPLPIWQYLAKPGFLPEAILAHSGRANKTICHSLFPARLKAVYRDLYAFKMQTKPFAQVIVLPCVKQYTTYFAWKVILDVKSFTCTFHAKYFIYCFT